MERVIENILNKVFELRLNSRHSKKCRAFELNCATGLYIIISHWILTLLTLPQISGKLLDYEK